MSVVDEIRKRTRRNPVLERKESGRPHTEKDIEEAAEGEVDISGIKMSELVMGVEVEYEHGSKSGEDTNVTNDEILPTLKIAVAHLREIPDYYTRLAQMEREGKEALKQNETDS
jgi:hypothetical protein